MKKKIGLVLRIGGSVVVAVGVGAVIKQLVSGIGPAASGKVMKVIVKVGGIALTGILVTEAMARWNKQVDVLEKFIELVEVLTKTKEDVTLEVVEEAQ